MFAMFWDVFQQASESRLAMPSPAAPQRVESSVQACQQIPPGSVAHRPAVEQSLINSRERFV
jgi:hypothetical protein